MLPPIQFLVQSIQIDVGQQRRQDGLNAKDNFEFDREVRYRQEGKKGGKST
jgi:hypothetical protein